MNSFLGNKEQAYHYLELLNQKKGWRIGLQHYTEIDPFFDNIRDEPRFKEIMKQAHASIDSMRYLVDQLNVYGEGLEL